jgi:Zn ribbon nucleic-acid-binding protein
VSGLELCPKCKIGHLYPLVTTRVSTEPKYQFRETGIRDYECDICGHKQKGLKQTQKVDVKDKVSASVKNTKKPKIKIKIKTKTKSKSKSKPKRKRG